MKKIFFFICGLFFIPNLAYSQFNTIVKDDEMVEVLSEPKELPKQVIEPIIQTHKNKVVPSLIAAKNSIVYSVIDSLRIDILNKRLSCCLPLDKLHLTSKYGYRVDPITRCPHFHDGIDLSCKRANVYAMMPGRIVRVKYSRGGYGNSIVLQYGDMECLYGHLSIIIGRVGDYVPAGTIVGISGSTGRSTGPHLHIAMKQKGKDINPLPFVDFLINYIHKLDIMLCKLR